MSSREVLIIDDEPDFVRVLAIQLKREGLEVQCAYTGDEGLSRVKAGFDSIVLLDLRLPDTDGLDLVEPLLALSPYLRIIIMTAHGSTDTAIEATRRGAYDFVAKGDASDLIGRLKVTIKNAFQDRDMTRRVGVLEQEVSAQHDFLSIVARSPQMTQVLDTLRVVSDSRVSVLVTGESGTGKEVVARAIHRRGPRGNRPFVAVNCAGIPDALLESELFGHERGAFTGAITAKKGKFELADGGTIFLDEIGEMPLHLQAKLLRVLQERAIERVGSAEPRPLDVRVISATSRHLKNMVDLGTFRDDLYYRLAVFPVHLPPLRERVGDVPLLARYFLRQAAEEETKSVTGFSAEVMWALEGYHFPGNVRELQNIISRAVVVARSSVISLPDLPVALVQTMHQERLRDEGFGRQDSISLDEAFSLLFNKVDDLPTMSRIEDALLRRALHLCGGHVERAARAVGMSRATFYRRLERLGGRHSVVAGETRRLIEVQGLSSDQQPAVADAEVSFSPTE